MCAKLNVALEMWNRDRIVSHGEERKERGEAAGAVPLAGTTGAALLGKGRSFLVAIALKPSLAGSKRGFLRNKGQKGCLHSAAACFAWGDPGEDKTPGSK